MGVTNNCKRGSRCRTKVRDQPSEYYDGPGDTNYNYNYGTYNIYNDCSRGARCVCVFSLPPPFVSALTRASFSSLLLLCAFFSLFLLFSFSQPPIFFSLLLPPNAVFD